MDIADGTILAGLQVTHDTGLTDCKSNTESRAFFSDGRRCHSAVHRSRCDFLNYASYSKSSIVSSELLKLNNYPNMLQLP